MFTEKDIELIICSYEKQASRLFKLLLLLLISNLIFIYLYFITPSPINIGLAQTKTVSSTQTVNR